MGTASAASGPVVYRVDVTGTVEAAAARTLSHAVDQAEDAHAAALLVRLDTPGGYDTAMRSMVKTVQGAKVPVLCWVGPSGARAASAGTFVLLACPVAAMAPGTNIG